MANNKIQLADGTVLLDLTTDSVDASHLAQGYTAHDCSGAAIVGTMSGGKPEQSKSATPTETAQTILPDEGYTLSSVDVGAISSTYVGSGITRQAAKTVTPRSYEFPAVAPERYTTGMVKIAAVPTETPSTITANGTYTATSGKWWTGVTVAIPVYDGSVS